MDLLNMPVTLVVKAPNQKIADHTVECGLDWTIKKLKEHLSCSYPSKPGEHQQKLIYSGKLLHDHLQLKDVLRQYEKDQSTHTVHLVCSTPPDIKPHTNAPTSHHMDQTTSHPSTSESDNYTAPSPVTSSDGVRQRHVHTGPNLPASPQTPQEAFQFQQYYGANPMMYGGFFPGMMPMSPEQMVVMQQMYAQQMAQYMQIYQQQNMFTPPGTPGLPPGIPGVDIPVTPAPAANQQAAPEPAANPRRAAEPVQRMNAQGGMVFDDEEEDERNRDWLDWIYTMSRLAVLLGIVYFYSTISRFFLVFSFFLMVYMYQRGWFQLRRQVRPNPQQGQEQQVAPQNIEPQPVAQPDPPHEDANAQEEAASQSDSDADTEATEDALPAEPAPPPPPGPIAVAWSFFTTFFSSLVPQQPPGVQGN